jgi:hypothetical protein
MALKLLGSLESSGGNVGIGTTSPTQKLDVTDGDFVVRDSAGINKVTITRFGGIELKGNGTGSRTVGTPNTDALSLATNNTSRIYITSAGNVGIGNTSPGNRLRIDAAAGQATTLANSITNAAVYINSDTGNGSNNIRIGESGSGSYFLQVSNSTGTSPYAINLNPFGGNVGIGTTSPAGVLDVQKNNTGDQLVRFWNTNTAGTGSSVVRIANSGNNNNGSRIEFTDNQYYVATISADRSQGIIFRTSATGTDPVAINERMRITTAGNVGIGTTSPYTKLVVGSRGTAAATSILAYDGIAFDFYNDGSPYKRHGVIISQAADASESVLDFNTKAASGTNSTKMTILGNGNVGIGTTSPSYKLSVNGDIHIPQNEYIYFDNTSHYIRRGASSVELQGYDGLDLRTNGSTRLFIQQAGNVH